jgi:ribosomal protein S18 acetylase RimI-like enzyme
VNAAGLSIRRATAGDIPAVLELWRRADAAPSVTDTAEDLARVVVAAHAHVLVAEDAQHEIVGSLIATFDGWRGNVYRMVVDPAHRRQGLALRLVADAEAWLRAAGARRVSALVEGTRPQAQAFWAAAGFNEYAGMRRYVKSV